MSRFGTLTSSYGSSGFKQNVPRWRRTQYYTAKVQSWFMQKGAYGEVVGLLKAKIKYHSFLGYNL